MQCSSSSDVIGEVVKLFKEDGIIKKRDSVIKELFRQLLINKKEFEVFLKAEIERKSKTVQINKEMRDDEIGKFCEQLAHDGKSKYLDWVQTVLLDTCYAKICLEKNALSTEQALNSDKDVELGKKDYKPMNFDMEKEKPEDVPVASPVSYHSICK